MVYGGLHVFEWGVIAVVGLLALVIALTGLVGLFQAHSLIRREFNAYFLSPIAYVILVLFLVVTGLLFSATMWELNASGPEGVEFPMRFMLRHWWFWMVFLVIPPVLSMRLFAEERGTGTLEVLMTAPLRDWQVVLSKYFACFAFYVLLWLPTLAYLPILLDLQPPMRLNQSANPQVWEVSWTVFSMLMAGGLIALPVMLIVAALPIGKVGRGLACTLVFAAAVCAGVGIWGDYMFEAGANFRPIASGIDPMPVLACYLALALAGAMFLAIGLLISSLVRSQLVAFLISMFICLIFIAAGPWIPEMDHGSWLYQGLYVFSVPLHFDQDFAQGLIDTRHLVLYSTMAVFCLFLTVRSLESRRWR